MSGDQLPSQLEAAAAIPIAQLSPDVEDKKTRVVRGVVTITWPYSIINKTVAFLLAEPDFRLRRAKGQVRVEFSGSSAKAVADAGLGSGDEVTLSLDGVELAADDSKTRVPGTSLEWQLKFKERLLLQAKITDSEEVKLLDIDHPAVPDPEPEPEQLPVSVLEPFEETAKTPEPAQTPLQKLSTKRPADKSLGLDEYASPAFLKRARTSYGALFEGSVDIFDDDLGSKARAKKRPKTGRYSGVWRYASQSPSPEPSTHEEEEADDTSMPDQQLAADTPSRPKMVDGACQTMELDTSPPRDVQVAAEARHDPSQFWQTPSKPSVIDSGIQPDLAGMTHTPTTGMAPNMNGGFGQPVPMPIFTSAHEHYHPAFDQAPLGPVFGHDIHQPGMEPQYHGQGPFPEHSDAYPEAGLEHGVDPHGQYPASFLETPQFDSHIAATSQPISESMPAYQDHHSSQGGHGAETGHHTTFIDGITEPQPVPWGIVSVQNSRPEERVPADGDTSTQAVPSDNWAEDRERRAQNHHEDPEGKQAALRAEEDQVAEDHDGPEEEFTSRTYAERHFEPEGQKEEAAATALVEDQGSDVNSSQDSDEEAEHEEDDAGGDYDITNYRNLSNNQDDDDGSDLESDYGQEEEEETFDPDVQGNEDDEVDEDAEAFGDEYDEYDEEEEYDDEDQENQRPPAMSTGPPQIISLLSDSEDEDDDPPLPASVPTSQLRQMPQQDESENEVDDDSEDEEESDTENVRVEDRRQSSSPVSSEEESEEEEEDESDGGTPTPKSRETTSKGMMGDSADMTSATIGEGLETMSPIRLPHVPDVSKADSSQPTSRDDSDMEAELEQELEQEIMADEARDNQKQLEVKATVASEVRTEETQAPATDHQAMDSSKPNTTVDTDVRTGEVRNVPQETSVAVDTEPTEGVAAEPMDINMAETDEKPVDNATGGEAEEHKLDVKEAGEPLLNEEHHIQSQLEDAVMADAPEEPAIIETSDSGKLQQSSTNETRTAGGDDTPQEAQVTQVVQVAIGTEVTESIITTNDDQDTQLGETGDAMDVDKTDDNDTKQTKTISPSPTQEVQFQPLEEAKLTVTQVSHAGEELGVEDDAQLVRPPTPGETQHTESFVSQSVFSQSFVETQITEAETDVAAPETANEAPLEKRPATATSQEPENPADPSSPINDESSQIRDSSAQPSEAHLSLIAEELAEKVNAAQPTPRRGRGLRSNKSDKDQDPSVKLARASIASRRSTRLSDRTTPDSTRVTRARSHSLVLKSDSPEADEDTSVQLAKAAIKSPSRTAREAKDGAAPQSPSVLKTQLAKSLRNDVPDCISLKTLRNHPGKNVDVLVIATTEPPEAKRAKGGPRGIMLAFNVTDHSVAPAQTVSVQIFRPHKAALPIVHPGDATLLRHFSIMSLTGRGFGLRANDGSSWAVFERNGDDGLPQIRGPPVELTEGETSYAALLKQWFAGLDAKSMAKLEKANEAAHAADAAAGKEDAK